MSISLTTRAGTGTKATFYVGRNVTGTLTVEFGDTGHFNNIVLTKTVTPAGTQVDLSLTAAEVDTIKDGEFRVKDSNGIIVERGSIGYIPALPNASVKASDLVNDPALRAAFVPKPSSAERRVYVSTSATANDSNDGLSWATAKRTIAGALASVTSPARIEVGYGTFNETTAQNWSGYKVTGAGRGLTTVHFPALGSGVAAITTGGSSSDISGMAITGAGGYALGAKNANVDGVRVTDPVRVSEVEISGFDSGIILASANGHTQFRDVAISNCYYGLYVTADGGDSYWTGCNINGNNFANVACRANAGDGGLNGTVFIKGHMGFAPYAVYQEAQNGGASNWMVNVRFLGCHFEAIGNGVFYTENQTGGLAYTSSLWLQDVGFSWSPTYKINARSQAYAAVFQTTADDFYYEPGSSPFTAGSSGIFYIGNSTASYRAPAAGLDGALTGPSGAIVVEGTTKVAQYRGSAVSMVQEIGPYMRTPSWPMMYQRVMINVIGLDTTSGAFTANFPASFVAGRIAKSVDATGVAGITISNTGITFPAGQSYIVGLIIVEGF